MKFQFWRKPTLRQIGDAYRNKAEWRSAAEAYRLHLAQKSGDGAIWVQLGHAEKENGDFEKAEIAYRRAAELMPDDSDVLVHLGDLLKRQARKPEALDVFRALLHLRPESEIMQQVRDLLPQDRSGAQVAKAGTIAIALEDFFQSFDQHSSATGVQRVQVGVVRAAIADPEIAALFFLTGRDQNGVPAFFSLARPALIAILDYVSGDVVDQRVLQSMLLGARLSAAPLLLGDGCTILHPGSFWTGETGVGDYIAALRTGARLMAIVYDIIPLTHPEYCEANLSRLFWQRLAELLYAADFIMTISDHTQVDLKRFIAGYNGRDVEMRTVPLAHALNLPHRGTSLPPKSIAGIKSKRYAAYVSTIEGRKNHIYVVKAWQAMIADGIDVPDLIFVGRIGWKADELSALLASTNNLDQRVHVVHGLSDGELDAVYRGALFTIFTSFTEGWGLPVGESLTRGIPCVASRISAIPEVGGDFVDYVDPNDLAGGIAVFRRMIEDDAYRVARQALIRKRFVPRTWDEVGAGFLAAVKGRLTAVPTPEMPSPVRLEEGKIYRPGGIHAHVEPVAEQLANPLSLQMTTSFYEPELHGAWLRGVEGELTFSTGAAPGEAIVLFFEFTAAPWAAGKPFSVSLTTSQGVRRWLTLSSTGSNFVRLEGKAAADATCTLMFRFDGEAQIPTGDVRRFGVALNAIGYVRQSETALRLDLREEFIIRAIE